MKWRECVELEDLTLLETHYPLDITGRFESSDPALAAIVPLSVRSLEMCMHQAYFDCPCYEQPTPHGLIEFELRLVADQLRGRISLPPGVTGTLHWAGQRRAWQGVIEL